MAFADGVWLKASRGAETKTAKNRASQEGVVRRWNPSQWRLLLVYREAPGQRELQALASRQIKPLSTVPPRGLLASVPDSSSLAGLDLEWYGSLAPEQKISPLLVTGGLLAASALDSLKQRVLVEFHADVPAADMLAILAQEQVSAIHHPDLLHWQLLVEGTAAQLAGLARWDEVAYLFPSSRELARGEAMEACSGALLGVGHIAQIVAKVGEGWDGPGLGVAALGYAFGKMTHRLPAEQVRYEVTRALSEWARYAQLRFAPASSVSNRQTIAISFETGNHDDGYPFDGPGRALAHTFFPAPPNPEPIAGDLHLDDDESWQLGTIDLFSVVLHEIGHALGLGHSDNPSAVMYPYYRRVTGLHSDDIATLRELYATYNGPPAVTPFPPTGIPPVTPPTANGALLLRISQPAGVSSTTTADWISLAGTFSGGSGAVQVSWSNSRGGAGIAQVEGTSWRVPAAPLSSGENVFTLLAQDASQGRNSQQIRVIREEPATIPPAPPAALFIRIDQPPAVSLYRTTESTISLSGVAGPAGRVAQISWVNGRGSGGSIAGSATWRTSNIALEPGLNRLQVTASDGQGGLASASLDVEYSPALPPPGPDTIAPTLTVLNPALPITITNSPTITLSGTATDNVGVTEVVWLAGSWSGRADGVTYWRIPDFPLQPGWNSILIRAADAAGNTAWRALTITRQ